MESKNKIILIIVISCMVVAGFIGVMVSIFFPTDTGPVLEFIPQPREENAGSHLIWYNTRNDDDIKHWVDSLNDFIEPYIDQSQVQSTDYVDCSDSNLADPYNGEVCRFDYRWLGQACTSAESWGYNRRSPCVILKLPNMIDWVPEVYTQTDLDQGLLPDEMPQDLRDHIYNQALHNFGEPPQMIWVSCHGENAADKEYIGELEYTPWQGFPAYYYFSYLEIPGYGPVSWYLPPLLAVRFKEPMSRVLINIECVPWAKNFNYTTKEGAVHFELLID